MNLIHEELVIGNYVDFQRILEVGALNSTTLRVRIHSDPSYHFQSTAVVEVWSEVNGWMEVYRPHPLSGQESRWDDMSRYSPAGSARKAAGKHADELIHVACRVLRAEL